MIRRAAGLVGAVMLVAGLMGCAGSPAVPVESANAQELTEPSRYEFAVLTENPQGVDSPDGAAVVQVPLFAEGGSIRVLYAHPYLKGVGGEVCRVDLLDAEPEESEKCEALLVKRRGSEIETVNLLLYGFGDGYKTVDVYAYPLEGNGFGVPHVGRLSTLPVKE